MKNSPDYSYYSSFPIDYKNVIKMKQRPRSVFEYPLCGLLLKFFFLCLSFVVTDLNYSIWKNKSDLTR